MRRSGLSPTGRLFRLTLGVLAVALLSATPCQARGGYEGAPAPAFEARTLDGRNVGTVALQGKVILLHFWATWCPPCREEMPALDAFYQAHRAEGFEVVAISVDVDADLAKVREFAKPFAFAVAMRSAAHVDGYGRIRALPLTFVIDRNGVMRKAEWTGEQQIDTSSLEKYVLPLLH